MPVWAAAVSLITCKRPFAILLRGIHNAKDVISCIRWMPEVPGSRRRRGSQLGLKGADQVLTPERLRDMLREVQGHLKNAYVRQEEIVRALQKDDGQRTCPAS